MVAIIGALVHVHAANAWRGAPNIEVYAPQGPTKVVGEVRGAFIVEGVRFVENKGMEELAGGSRSASWGEIDCTFEP